MTVFDGRTQHCLRCGTPITWVGGRACNRWLEYVRERLGGATTLITESGSEVSGDIIEVDIERAIGAVRWGYRPHECRRKGAA